MSLSPAQIRLIERITARRMTDGGYPPAVLPREPSALSVLWARLREVPETVRFGWTGLRIGLALRDPGKYDSEEVDGLFRLLNPPSWARYPSLNGQIKPEPPPRRLPAPRTAEEQS
jgi:hypothetical protein